MYAFGSIVLARFPFTDLSGAKRRPALVVSADGRKSDLVVSFITSVLRDTAYSAPIDATPLSGLKTASVVLFDKLATLNLTVIDGRIGSVSADWIAQHRATFLGVFGFSTP